MSVTYKTTNIVAALSDMKGMKLEEMLARTAELFPDAGLEQMHHAFEIAADDAREEARKMEAESKWLDSVAPVFDGLPKGTTLEEAAMEADPKNWRQDDDGVWHWLGEGKMPDTHAMIERFQINHPAEALRIEDEIMAKA
jgi:hypothetical protein